MGRRRRPVIMECVRSIEHYSKQLNVAKKFRDVALQKVCDCYCTCGKSQIKVTEHKLGCTYRQIVRNAMRRIKDGR